VSTQMQVDASRKSCCGSYWAKDIIYVASLNMIIEGHCTVYYLLVEPGYNFP